MEQYSVVRVWLSLSRKSDAEPMDVQSIMSWSARCMTRSDNRSIAVGRCCEVYNCTGCMVTYFTEGGGNATCWGCEVSETSLCRHRLLIGWAIIVAICIMLRFMLRVPPPVIVAGPPVRTGCICAICMDDVVQYVTCTTCRHSMHQTCWSTYINSRFWRSPPCPMCRSELMQD